MVIHSNVSIGFFILIRDDWTECQVGLTSGYSNDKLLKIFWFSFIALDQVYVIQTVSKVKTVITKNNHIFNQGSFLYYSFQEHLPDHKTLPVHSYYEWFEPAVDKWLDLAKFKVGITQRSKLFFLL